MPRKTPEREIAEQCFDGARRTLGDGWGHVSTELQWGLVASKILDVLLNQPASVPPAEIVAYMHTLHSEAFGIMAENSPV